jgi:hypothetical protein
MATSKKVSGALARPFLAGLVIAGCAFTMCAGDAMAQRGGGGRGGGGASRGGGGGGSSASRGTGNHGGRTAQASVSGGNRSSANRSGNASANRSGNANANRSGNSASSTRNSGNRSTNVGSNNNVNIEGRDVNIDVEGGCCGGGNGWGYRHPVAAGVTIGAIAGSVAAATGAYYYSLPPSGCVTVVRAGANYYQCGTAYYQEAMNGSDVVYVSASP